MESTESATAELLFQDKRVKVWRWTFESHQATGMHVHEYDYIAIPITGGTFEITTPEDSAVDFIQIAGEPYARDAGVHHNVKFVGEGRASFVEIEHLK